MESKATLYGALQQRIYGEISPGVVFKRARGSKYLIQCLKRSGTLSGHDGCVNTIAWSECGELLLSGSDDCRLNIYRPCENKLVQCIRSGHRANIFSAKFMPCSNNKWIVSCAGDGMLQFTNLDRPEMIGTCFYNCHTGTTYEVITTPGDSNTFLSCGEDGTVRMFDIRTKQKCAKRDCREDVLIDCAKAITSISINPQAPYQLAVGCENSTVRVFDRRSLSTANHSSAANKMRGMVCKFRPDALSERTCRVTSLSFSDDGGELLVSYCADYLYLFNMRGPKSSPLTPGSNGENDHSSSSPQRSNLPLKRLRLRGDWSDTGPNARPESEATSTESNLMQRMSDMFVRWIEESFRANQRGRGRPVTSSVTSSSSASPDSLHVYTSSEGSGGTAVPEGAQGSRRGASSGMGVVEEEGVGMRASRTHGQSTDETSAMECTPERTDTDLPQADSTARPMSSSNSQNDEPMDLDTSGHRPTQEEATSGQLPTPDEATSGGSDHKMTFVCFREAYRGELDYEDGNLVDGTSDAIGGLGVSDRGQGVSCGRGPGVQRQGSPHDVDDAKDMSSKTKEMDLKDAEPLELPDCTVATFERRVGETKKSVNGGGVEGQSSAEDQDRARSSREVQTTGEATPSSSSSMDQGSSEGPAGYARGFAATRIQRMYREHRNAKAEKETWEQEWERGGVNQDRELWRPEMTRVYKGHRNARTMIKEAAFWGDRFVVSGSDCGRIFIWDKNTCEIVVVLQGDKHVVNCIQPHPFDPILASSGIDYDIKLWSPSLEYPQPLGELDEIIKRNEKMLEESRDTITVPASFMLRMLASLNHARFARRSQDGSDSDTSEDD
ncbi:DDB1- and CUL4-associated factor 6 isoform X2 [Nematostella vectensis]|uniref:DDB1- and CUL4-associated factor 6 isoform X2 n=1 Tax=Nematostella vectensis TaxID=45351 RepID=UPI002076D696|nr:DDB1- and CUL4-associated factor 6 isoform X2 [Nematostella vectensis]